METDDYQNTIDALTVIKGQPLLLLNNSQHFIRMWIPPLASGHVGQR